MSENVETGNLIEQPQPQPQTFDALIDSSVVSMPSSSSSSNNSHNHPSAEKPAQLEGKKNLKKPLVNPDYSNRKRAKILNGTIEENEDEKEVPHIFERNGLRCVAPYSFEFKTFVKGRWMNRNIMDVFTKEFYKSATPSHFMKEIEAGSILVNGTQVTADYIFRDLDFLTHKTHRHEPPVIASAIEVLHEDENLITVNKPSSLPVHPCGRYRHNSVIFMLRMQGFSNLRNCHRLDRLTSGLMIFAKNLATSQKLEKMISTRQVSKEYVCRVYGQFPSDPIICNEPILQGYPKIGICSISPEGKPCTTNFSLIRSDGETSLVRCVPETGRMHQIRVHLQFLGFPIVGDPIYSDEGLWTFEMERMKKEKERVSQEAFEDLESKLSKADGSTLSKDEGVAQPPLPPSCSLTSLSPGTLPQPPTSQSMGSNPLKEPKPSDSFSSVPPVEGDGPKLTAYQQRKEQRDGAMRLLPDNIYHQLSQSSSSTSILPPQLLRNNPDAIVFDPACEECVTPLPDPHPNELFLYLHALKYSSSEWSFSTPMPLWADSSYPIPSRAEFRRLYRPSQFNGDLDD